MGVVWWYGSDKLWRMLKTIDGGVCVETLWRLLVNLETRVGYVGGKAKNSTARQSP